MKLIGRASDNLNSTVYLSRALISLDCLEQDAARDDDALRRLGDPVEGGLDVVRRQLGAVAELHPLAEEKGVSLGVLGDLPAMRQVRDDRLAAVARVAPDQIVEHASHGAEIENGAGLVQVEMRRPHRDAHADHAAMFRIGFGCHKLKFGPVELQRDLGGKGAAPAHRVTAHRGSRAALQKIAAVPPRLRGTKVDHPVPPLSVLSEARRVRVLALGPTYHRTGGCRSTGEERMRTTDQREEHQAEDE